MLCTLHKDHGLLEHVFDESDDVETGESGGVAFVILDEPAASRGPYKGPFHNPPSRQKNEAALGLGRLDLFGFNPFGLGRPCCRLSGVAMANYRQGKPPVAP